MSSIKMIEKIFKTYDLRGKYPKEINEEIAFKIGQAFVEFIKKEKPKRKKIDILIGQDNRLSSPSLFRALAKGITEAGANVISLGICPTPLFYFASKHCHVDDSGIMITASHLAKDYNGFKLVKELPIPIDSQTGLKKIKNLLTKKFKPGKKKGKIIKKNLLKEYIKFNLRNFNFKKIKPLKIITDVGNGAAGIVISKIFKKTNCRVFHLFLKNDGRFPNRDPDCNKKGGLLRLKKEILKKKADLGIAFDGDGDRIVFLDEKGKIISPNLITSLISEVILKERPKEKIIYTTQGSRIVPETIKKNSGKPIISKVGHSIIKRKMKKENIFFGAEISGHYYLRGHYFSEAPFFVLFKLLEEISKKGKTISQLVKPFKKYFYFSLNLKIKNGEEKILKLKKFFSQGKILEIDGLKIDYPNWGFNLRKSKTEENVFRLTIEAKNRPLVYEKIKKIKKLLKIKN